MLKGELSKQIVAPPSVPELPNSHAFLDAPRASFASSASLRDIVFPDAYSRVNCPSRLWHHPRYPSSRIVTRSLMHRVLPLRALRLCEILFSLTHTQG